MTDQTQSSAVAAEKDAPLPEGYCPTCGATGRDECASRTGRDHPARRHFALGWNAALRTTSPGRKP